MSRTMNRANGSWNIDFLFLFRTSSPNWKVSVSQIFSRCLCLASVCLNSEPTTKYHRSLTKTSTLSCIAAMSTTAIHPVYLSAILTMPNQSYLPSRTLRQITWLITWDPSLSKETQTAIHTMSAWRFQVPAPWMSPSSTGRHLMNVIISRKRLLD